MARKRIEEKEIRKMVAKGMALLGKQVATRKGGAVGQAAERTISFISS